MKLKNGSLECFIILMVFINVINPSLARGVNGGMSCAVCTVLTGVALQLAEIHEDSIANATAKLCNYLPSSTRKECFSIIKTMEPFFQNLSSNVTPDLFCLVYGTCSVDPGELLCHLFPLPLQTEGEHKKLIEEMELSRKKLGLPKIDVCKLPVIKDICEILNNTYMTLDAVQDFDGDGFSLVDTARGANWKGKDCADYDSNSYPGRKPFKVDVDLDSNCNGISGMDPQTNKPWEEVLCGEFKPRGLIFLGDSIGAHFHMPQVWINPLEFHWPDLNITDIILDEIDWPQHGFATGYQNITTNILIKGPVDSIYLKLRKRNRCNHRDYQNVSQNGASSFEGVYHANAVSRNQTVDYPAIVVYAMQGNDVCNNFKDTISHMTPKEVFRRNIMKSLFVLNEKLPKDSHVVLVGLVEADFIYSAMAKLLHPIGVLHKNVYYEDMYNWFNCLQIGPCNGWLNSNETLRNLTTTKAKELTGIVKEIVQDEKFDHFKLHFVENPINVVMSSKKINVPVLLESVDSLHPNQFAQPILAETMWKMLEDLPEVLGPINIHNERIEKLFGDQGGH